MAPHHLISIGPSHYCEKARWALQRAGVDFTETKHIPGFHMLFVKKLGGGTSCPKLVLGAKEGAEKQVLHQSSDILKFADSNFSEEADRLFPADEPTCKLVEEWEKKFDDLLGPHVRRWAYSYLLFDKSSFKLLSDGASTKQKIAAWPVMPMLRRGIAKGINMNKPEARDRSLQQIRAIFGEVDVALADGRPFICGERFTAADLTFAALAGPVVAAPGSATPPLDDLPKEFVEEVRKLRETTAGKLVLHLYETERQRVVGPKASL